MKKKRRKKIISQFAYPPMGFFGIQENQPMAIDRVSLPFLYFLFFSLPTRATVV